MISENHLIWKKLRVHLKIFLYSFINVFLFSGKNRRKLEDISIGLFGVFFDYLKSCQENNILKNQDHHEVYIWTSDSHYILVISPISTTRKGNIDIA